jgi:hypothetical protein
MDYCSLNTSLLFVPFVSPEKQGFCEEMMEIRNVIYSLASHIMLILYLVLFIISISGQIKEDYRWFILNSIIINIIMSCFNEVFIFFPETVSTQFYVYFYINYLSLISCFQIALNRFLYMYFTHFYRNFFNTKFLITSILLFDFITIGLDILFHYLFQTEIYTFNTFSIQSFVMFFILLSFAMIFSILLFIKIFQQSKLLDTNSLTLKNAKRAAVYCILQASLSFINLFTVFLCYLQFYVKNQSSLEYVSIFLAVMIEIIYCLTLICDAIITLTVLQHIGMLYGSLQKLLRKRFIE